MTGPTAPPPRLASRWAQWRRARTCARTVGHCWHPGGFIDWWCCVCAADVDGMPPDRCRLCVDDAAFSPHHL